MPLAPRVEIRRRFRPPGSGPNAERARDLKVWLTQAVLSLLEQRSRGLRYVAGVVLSASMVFGPVVEIARSLRANVRYGRLVRARFGVGRMQQFVDMLTLDLREPETFGFLTVFQPTPMFYADWMFLLKQQDEAHLYYTGFPGIAFAANFLALKPTNFDVRDPMFPFSKLWVYERLRLAEVPTVEPIAVLGRGSQRFFGDDHVLPSVDLFAKPNQGKGGIGAVRWVYSGAGYEANNGTVSSAQDLLDDWRNRRGTVIVQRCLRNHPDLQEIGGQTLSTVRVHTVLDRKGTPRWLPDAFLKLPAGNAVADNVHFGGLGVPVDMASGRLGVAVNPDFQTVDTNPVTGVQFRGRVMPHWHAVLALAVAAHEALRPAVLIGFDIAVLAEGPVVLEANSAPVTSDHLTHLPMAAIKEMDLLLFHLERLATHPSAPAPAGGQQVLQRK